VTLFYPIISVLLLTIAIVCFLNLSPGTVTDDIMKLITPKNTLRNKAMIARGRNSCFLASKLNRIKAALETTGKGAQFKLVCSGSLALFIAGCFISTLIGNLFLFPALSSAMALMPFLYIQNTLSHYDRHIKEELETCLSIISTSYIRSEDIISAVSENLIYIKPPIRDIFRAFIGDATAVSSDIKRALYRLKNKVDNTIFTEWCDTLIQCQDDRTLKDTLLPVVGKLTDVRLVNNELKTMLLTAKNEYWIMVVMVVLNIPLLYMLNKDWFDTLTGSTPGKIVLGICGLVILITAFFMLKFTKPIEYKR
jgi:Flp pilus assembly protein TadB